MFKILPMRRFFNFRSNVLKSVIGLHRLYSSEPVDLAYKIHGPALKKDASKSPIIICHGFLGNKKNWESVSKALVSKTKRTVVAVDIRNHGDSPHTQTHTYEDLASDIDKLLETLEVKEAVLIGHSMGGRASMVYTLLKPKKVAGLIVVDISPVERSESLSGNFFPSLLSAMRNVEVARKTPVPTARNQVKDQLKKITNCEATLNFIVMNYYANSHNQLGWKINIKTLKDYYRTIARFPEGLQGKTYEGPTLFIAGKNSDYVAPEDMGIITSYFPNAEMRYITAGHNVHAEAPAEFLGAVHMFLHDKKP